MFATSGLFSALPCPYLPACPREAFCIFSHAPLPVTDTPAAALTTSSPAAAAAASAADKTAKRKLDKPVSTEGTSNGTSSKVVKQPRLEDRPASKQAPTSTLQTSKQPSTPGAAKPVIGAVLMGRPQPLQKASTPSSSTKV